MTKLLRLMAVALALAWCAAAVAAQPSAVVAQGRVVGFQDGRVNVFLGIPYAAPPVGQNRWRAPGPAPHWKGTRVASHFGASCWQPRAPWNGFGPWTHEYNVDPNTPISESCLYLNVWAPRARSAHVPVLVWIYGGGFIGGSGSVAIYNGANLAAQGILVVAINYRLGPFGFLITPGLAKEAIRAHEPPGNYGLQDMIAALRWIRDNIAAFGGDPRQVTVAGQSAGAISINDLLISPLAVGLFQRAIIESGLPSLAPPVPLAQAERAGQTFMKAHRVQTLSALRALPPGRLIPPGNPMKGPRFGPIVDGVLLSQPAARLLAHGRNETVPVLIGMTADERSASSPETASLNTTAWYTFLRSAFGEMASRFAQLYPSATGAQRARAKRTLQTDLGLAGLYDWASERLAHARAPVYAYLWTHVEPGPQSARWGAFHSSEIPYVFGTLGASTSRPFSAADRRISRQMSAYWVNFVKTGDPNGQRLAAWPKLERPDGDIMALGARMRARPM
ncbi:MAG: carboxylesterase/lipase family protein, partial [Acetobacteraceae bacterium]